jgi:TPR repeat protein
MYGINEGASVQPCSIRQTPNGKDAKQDFANCCFKNSADEEAAGATKRYRAAANAGDVAALVYLDFEYYRSICANPDYAEAAANYRKKAEQGSRDAQTLLAFMNYFGNGVNQNYAEAFQWFQKAAAQDDEYAQICLGYMYFCGRGVQQNKEMADQWYRYAAQYDNQAVQVHLADLFFFGLSANFDRGFAEYLYQIAAHKGYAPAMCRLGEIDLERGNSDWAMEWYMRAAESGFGPAQFKLGDIYRQKGAGYNFSLGKVDYIPEYKQKADEWFSKAAVWYRNAVEHGYVNANTFLALLYRTGLGGVQQDLNKAKELYKKAAMHGYVEAQFELGCIYEEEKNIPEATKWLQKAADQGHYMAKLLLCSIQNGEVMKSQLEAERRLRELYY